MDILTKIWFTLFFVFILSFVIDLCADEFSGFGVSINLIKWVSFTGLIVILVVSIWL